MKKRFLSFALMTALVLSLCGGAAVAAETRASDTIRSFTLSLVEGEGAGEVKIKFDVRANSTADEIGISSIVIYKTDGSYASTIMGTKGNGLILTNTSRHNSSYTYKGTSGTSYFARVTCTATIGSSSDSKTLDTNKVTAP